MAAKPVSAEELQAALDADRKYPTKIEAANSLGLKVPTFKSRLEQARSRGIGREDGLAPSERQRLEDQITDLRAQLRAAHREAAANQDIRSSVYQLAQEPLRPPKWVLRAGGKQLKKNTPILFTSDFQWGEVINLAEMDGVNEYSPIIARKRYQRLIERTIDLSFNHMTTPEYDGIFYLRGGDSISGDIHEELRETNELSSAPAMKDMAESEIWGIEKLSEAFGKVHVISVPGNHGRTTVKSHSKHYADLNWDDVLSWSLEVHFSAKKDSRVTFFTPRSGDAYFEVAGQKVLLTHGDRIGSRGGMGFIGPVATIARGMRKTKEQYAQVGKQIDKIFVGHFHTSLELEDGWANGALCGFGEYARDLRAKPHPPTQWLLFAHPKWGFTARWPVRVDDPK